MDDEFRGAFVLAIGFFVIWIGIIAWITSLVIQKRKDSRNINNHSSTEDKLSKKEK